MLRLLHSPKRFVSGLTRRDFLQASSLAALGLGGGDHAAAGERGALGEQHDSARRERMKTLAADPAFGRAKRCVLLYLYGAASQIETFDPKPEAPVEVRGELGAIDTCLPGVQIGELLPLTSQIVDRATIVRSMSHPYPLHASAFTLTSIPTIDVPLQMSPRDPRHWPFIGSVVDYLADRRGEPPPPIPRNVGLPWRLSSRRPYAAGDNAGPYGAWLGPAYDPIWTEFTGQGTRTSTYTFGPQTIRCQDPYGPLAPGCRFSLSGDAELQAGITLDRLDDRRSLLTQFDDARRELESPAQRQFDATRRQAFDFLATRAMRDALDVDREPAATRERYGMTLFGQSTLVARRLLEAGTQFVTVLWDEFELVNSAWDTHYYHYELMREQLCPGFDRAFSALVLDLEQRGLLDETLIVCTTEHGRTPKLEQDAAGGGRGHWAPAYASVLVGGGAARGRVVGRTDRIAGTVVDTPVSPKDLLATMYYLLGVDPETIVHDRLNRPVPIGGAGLVRRELLA